MLFQRLKPCPNAPCIEANENRGAREYWNPRAGHFENVREGTFQDDLDYNRCRYR